MLNILIVRIKKEDDSCGKCYSCLKFNKLIHPDLHFIYSVASVKNNAKPVSDDFSGEWRQIILSNPFINLNLWYETIGIENKQGIIGKEESSNIIRKLSLKTFEANYKIMIIWMADKMNDTCANKILKILEEPPDNTLFLMVTESTEQILTTILLRTQLLKIPKISEQDILNHLKIIFTGQEYNFGTIAHMANGNYLKALQLTSSNQQDLFNHEKYTELMRIAYKSKVIEAMQWVDEMSKLGREGLKNFLDYALRFTRENYLTNLKLGQMVYIDETEKNFVSNFHILVHNSVVWVNEKIEVDTPTNHSQ